MYRARVKVSLKQGVLDPQGEAIKSSLHAMDYSEVQDVQVGKLINLSLTGENRELLASRVEDMCQRLLANPVIEDYEYEIMEVEAR